MRKLIREFFSPETLRYLVFGLLTVALNVLAYRLLAPALGTLWANIHLVMEDDFYRRVGPKLYGSALCFAVLLIPIDTGRSNALLIERGGNLAVCHTGASHTGNERAEAVDKLATSQTFRE